MKRLIPEIVAVFFLLILYSCSETKGAYVCPPCNLSCDKLTFDNAGICPHCNMTLLKVSDLHKKQELLLNQITIKEGSGVFLIEGRKNNKNIKVYYHQPKNFQNNSKILLVIPGAGRNADSYRNAWIEESEKHNVLILSPMYAEKDYAFEDYHLGGVLYDLNLKDAIKTIPKTNKVVLDESLFSFKISDKRNEWIFSDFDRIFELVVKTINSNQTKYDIFGHSAGGQILHRFALFQPDSKADQILASNSGFYTIPDFTIDLPFGIKNTILTQQDLKSSFSKNLTLLIGELDNETETGGTLLRSTTVDKQGIHRLERANYFYNQAKIFAKEKGYEFNWNLKIIPNIGHNHEKMANAAAEFLYSTKN